MLIALTVAFAAEPAPDTGATVGRIRGVDYQLMLPEDAVLGEAFELSDGPMTVTVSARMGVPDPSHHATLQNGHRVVKVEERDAGTVVVHRKEWEKAHYGTVTAWLVAGVSYYVPGEGRDQPTLICEASSPERTRASFDVHGWTEAARAICTSLTRVPKSGG